MATREMQRAMLVACLGRGVDDRLAGDLGAFLEEHGVAEEDRAAVLELSPRIGLYRRLVRANVVDVIERMMPRARARINDAAHGAFDRAVESFLAEIGPRTHHLRDVPTEFLDWAAPRLRADAAVPAYGVDLAVYELAEFQMSVAVAPASPPPVGEVVVDRPLAFAETRRLVALDHAIDELPEAIEDRSAPRAERTHLLVYRDADAVVRFLRLSPLAAAILGRLFAGETLAAAMPAACAEVGLGLDDDILADTARLLADLAERGLFLGAALVD